MSDIVNLTPEQEEYVVEFSEKLNEFICESENEELGYDYPTLIQEVVGFAVYRAYMLVDNIDRVTFALGKIKQLAIKERQTAEQAAD